MKKTLLALALMGAATTANADSWLYGGINAGQSDLNGNAATAMSAHVGTGILPIIGVEAGFWNHGKFDGGTEASSVYAALKPSIDFGPLHVYAKGGIHNFKLDNNGTKAGDGTKLMYGVGVEYFVMDMLSVGGSYQQFKFDENNIDSIGSFTLNATIHFL
ncbi:outer membrane beta-barrel protein [Vibrio penaeicida]|uniref:outer membrane beta-barrel protein n=1 Tax=Vibrio penaeicida TaxID=104609 RepID=UPI000CEA3AE2|nr:outer membrane beta-barrel protein [Vibrio penaeicida]